MIDPAPIQNEIVVQEMPLMPWQRWFRQVADWIQGADKLRTWTPVFTGGAGTMGTVQGTFARVGTVVYFQLTATPTGAWTSTAGATSVSLPIQGRTSTQGLANVYANSTAALAITSSIDGTLLLLPTFTTSAPFRVSGWYFAGT